MSDCISYNPSMIELFIPSPTIFYTLCVSTDKTSLFLTSLIRLIIFILLYYTINDMINYDKYPYLQNFMISMISINVLYIGMIICKNPIFNVRSDHSMFAKSINIP